MTPLHLRRRQSHETSGNVAPTAAGKDGVAEVSTSADASTSTDGSGGSQGNGVAGVSNVADVAKVEVVVGDSNAMAGSTTVVVVGSGSTESVPLVMTLESSGHRVVAAEHDPFAATLRLAQLGAVIPPPDDSQFPRALELVAKRSGASAVLASGSAEMRALAEARPALEEAGVTTWSPCLDVFTLCADRSSLYEALDSSGLSVEKTGIGPIEQNSGKGRQFSVDVIVGRDHEVLAAVSSWRLASEGDTTIVAETFFDPRLLELMRAICATILIEGPVVIEGYASEFGRALLSDVRPGFSSLVALSRAAGVDVVALALDGALGREMPTRLLSHRPGVRMVRYLDQVFEG